MLAGSVFRHQQHKHQRYRFAIGRIEIHGFFQADKRAGGRLHFGMPAMRDGHAVPQRGSAELFARKQAFKHSGAAQAGFAFQQQASFFKQAFFAAHFQIQHNMRYGQDIADQAHGYFSCVKIH